MDVFIQRLRDEFEVSVIACAPTVPYTYVLKSGEKVTIKSPSEVPDPITVREVLEPMACVDIVTPAKHLGAIMEIFRPRRAEQTHLEYLDEETVSATYLVPWQDVVSDLSDESKQRHPVTARWCIQTHLRGRPISSKSIFFSTVLLMERYRFLRIAPRRSRAAVPSQSA